MVYKLGNTKLVVKQGDITDEDIEAVVNAANNQLYMGAGVAGAIKKRGGHEIEDEAVSKGPITVGSAVITSGGDLKAKYVIHAAVMGIDLITDEDKIRKAMQSALKVADEKGIKSIAFPALGTGVGGYPFNEAARIMFDVVREHLENKESTLEKVVFVLFGYEAYNEFLNRADKEFEKK